MRESNIQLTETNEVVRRQVIPAEIDPNQGDSDGDRSPIDEETKRDSPVEPLPDDQENVERVRQPILPE